MLVYQEGHCGQQAGSVRTEGQIELTQIYSECQIPKWSFWKCSNKKQVWEQGTSCFIPLANPNNSFFKHYFCLGFHIKSNSEQQNTTQMITNVKKELGRSFICYQLVQVLERNSSAHIRSLWSRLHGYAYEESFVINFGALGTVA